MYMQVFMPQNTAIYQQAEQDEALCFNGEVLSDADIPTPLPVFPSEEKNMSNMPYDGDSVPPTLVDDDEEVLLDALLNKVFEKEFVQAARGIRHGDCVLIAVLTEPFFLKSERDAARKDLEEELKQVCGTDVVVAFDMHLFRQMDGDLNQNEKEELIRIAKRKTA